MPSTVTTSSLVTPTLAQREVIALLIIAGQQFEEFKHIVWPDSDLHHQTIYSALKTVQGLLRLNEYVPPNRRCLVINKCLQYPSQLKKLYELVGQFKINFIGDLDVQTMIDEAMVYYVPRYYDEPHNFIHTCLPSGDRDPIKWGSASQLCIRSAVERLSQPDYEDYFIEITTNLTKEEPALPSRLVTRPGRKRRFSELAIDVDPHPVMKTKTLKRACFDLIRKDNSDILADAFSERIVPAFIYYCRSSWKTMKERWLCSLNLRHQWKDIDRCDDSLIHPKCAKEVKKEDSIIQKQSLVKRMYDKRNYREFDPIVTGQTKKELI